MSRDGKRGMEHIDAVAFCRDVKLVVLPEKLSLRAARLEKSTFVGSRLLENGLEDLFEVSFSEGS